MGQFSLIYLLKPQMVIDFNAYTSKLKDWFLARDYSEKVVSEQIRKVVFGKQATCKDISQQVVPFLVTYHPKL